MLLITDRQTEALHLQKALAKIQPCIVVALHQITATTHVPALVIFDVGIDNVSSRELFRLAISPYRNHSQLPVLCLTRSDSDFADMKAYASQYIRILPSNTSQAQIIETVKQMRALARPLVQASDEVFVRECVNTAGCSLKGLFDAARRRKPISTSELEIGGDAVIAAVAQLNMRGWLDIVWSYDDITYQHCLLVAGLVASFASKLGLSIRNQQMLSQAALLHDIGKANIPLEILNKPDKLSDAEMSIMKKHPAIGYDFLGHQKNIDHRMLDVVRHHHEYLDGSGYPDALQGDQISNFVRLVTICDIYAALIEKRSYKMPMPRQKALSILADMGNRLDRRLLREFQVATCATC